MARKKRILTEEQKERNKVTRALKPKKKYPLTEEQKAKYEATRILRRANRSLEEVEKDKAAHNIANAKCMANRSLEKIAEYKAKKKISKNKWYQDNKEEQKRITQEWKKENPNTIKKYTKAAKLKNDLGYFVVYIIPNYMGKGDHYCGQTGNLYNRMKAHRSVGRMNTESHRILGCFRTREQALAFEAIQHEQGYHGYNGGI